MPEKNWFGILSLVIGIIVLLLFAGLFSPFPLLAGLLIVFLEKIIPLPGPEPAIGYYMIFIFLEFILALTGTVFGVLGLIQARKMQDKTSLIFSLLGLFSSFIIFLFFSIRLDWKMIGGFFL